MNRSKLKDKSASFLIIGAGAVGSGVAYTLAKAGFKNVTVLERENDVAKVTTSQGAGLCGQVRNSIDRVRLAMRSVATFRELQKDSVAPPEWREVGSLRIALSDEKKQDFVKLASICQGVGLNTSWLSAEETVEKCPAIDVNEIAGSLWCPSDGYLTPYRLVKSYERQCIKMGCNFVMGVEVNSFLMDGSQIQGVVTQKGDFEADFTILAAGAHAYPLALKAGLELPVVPVRHAYFVTTPLTDWDPDWPCLRIPEMSIYGRVSNGSLLLGGWERVGHSMDPRQLASEENSPSIRTDWGVLLKFERDFAKLVPNILGAQKAKVAKGWPTFTPDGHFIIGESTKRPGLVMAVGCNAHGISGSAGIGSLLLEALTSETPSNYVTSLSPDRFSENCDWSSSVKEARSVYEHYYSD